MAIWNIIGIRELSLLLPGIILAGCATLMNNDEMSIRVFTRPSGLKMHVSGDSATYTTPVLLLRKRSSEDLHLTFESDSARKQVVVPSQLSGYYLLNLYPPLWPGLLLDGERKYTYEDEVYVAMNDTTNSYWTWDVFDGPNTFRWGLNLSYFGVGSTEVTWNVFEKGGSHPELMGINSLGIILQYVPEPLSLYMLTADARTTIMGECFGNCSDSRSTMTIALLRGREWRNVWPVGWLAAGVHGTFSSLYFEEERGAITLASIRRTAEIGPAFSGACRFLGQFTWLVMSYQPGIFEFDRGQFIYSHQLSVALRLLML